jgi:hypothetical protein
LKTSKGVTSFSVELSQSENDCVVLHIPILQHNEGAIIEVWHTACTDIDITNADIHYIQEFTRQKPKNMLQSLISYSISITTLFFLGVMLYSSIQSVQKIDIVVFGVFVLTFAGSGYLILRNNYKYTKFPKWSRLEYTSNKTRKRF